MKKVLAIGGLAAALVLGGCAPYATEVSFGTTVYGPPPAPYVEVVGAAPGPGFVWINGYWWWDGRDYVWMRGRWDRPPQRGYVWVRSGWVYRGGHYRFVRGHWISPSRRVHVRYVHAAPAVRVRPGPYHYRAVPRSHVHVRTRRGYLHEAATPRSRSEVRVRDGRRVPRAVPESRRHDGVRARPPSSPRRIHQVAPRSGSRGGAVRVRAR